MAIFAVSLSKNRAQGACERQFDLVVDLRLVDAGQLVLHRIFNRDDVRILRLQRGERRTERGGLAAARRTDDENHAVLVAQEMAQLFERHGRKAKLFERRHALAVVEDAKHDLLAVQRAQRRHAEVHFSIVFGGYADAPVLRQPLLGDVHAGHDLQARDQSLVHPFGQVHHFLQQPVETMAHEHALFERLDVDIARVAADGAADNEIDEVDDRRGLALFLETGNRLEHLFVGAAGQRGFGARRLLRSGARARRLHEAGRRGRRPRQRLVRIALLDGVQNFSRGRDDLLDAIAGLEFQVLHQAEQQRIGHRHGEQVLFQPHRDAGTLHRDVLWNQDDSGSVGRVLDEVDVGEAQLVSQRLRDLLLGGEVHPYEHRPQAVARALVFGERDLQVGLANQPRLDETLTDLLAQGSSLLQAGSVMLRTYASQNQQVLHSASHWNTTT
jgi:hypothetical protein